MWCDGGIQVWAPRSRRRPPLRRSMVAVCADWAPVSRRCRGCMQSLSGSAPLCSRACSSTRGWEVHVRARIDCAVRALLFPPHGAGSVRGSPAAPDLAEEPGLAEELPSPPSALHAHRSSVVTEILRLAATSSKQKNESVLSTISQPFRLLLMSSNPTDSCPFLALCTTVGLLG